MGGGIWLSEKQAAFLVAGMAAALLAGAVILPSSGIQPFGEDAVQKQIAQEDSAVCARFGLAKADDPRSAECMAELADLRQRHERLVATYSQL